MYTITIETALGKMSAAGEDTSVLGLWFSDQKKPPSFQGMETSKAGPWEETLRQWLSAYFAGKKPAAAEIPLRFSGTIFQERVWSLLREIPYGKTVSYGSLAKSLSPRMASQAVGGAVGRNPVSIIVPCHRVVGKSGQLVGYAGGLERKQALLTLEES